MKSLIKLFTWSVFFGLLFIGNTKIAKAADYELSLSAYNITNACSYDTFLEDGGQSCYESALKGNLEANRISDNLVKADQMIMVLVNFKTLNTESTVGIGGYTASFTYDTTKLTPLYDDEWGDYFFGNINDYANKKILFPKVGTKQWAIDYPTYDDDGFVVQLATNDATGKALLKLTDPIPLYAAFFRVNSDISGGAEIPLKIKTAAPSKTAFSDLSGVKHEGSEDGTKLVTYKGLTLSTGGGTTTLDTDATLKSVTINGTANGTEYTYPLDPTFNKDQETYSVIVPNSVSNITISGEPTKTVNGIDGFTTHNLDVGSNIIMVKVTAQDATTTKTYVFNVTRLSNDATLKSISASYTHDSNVTNIDFGTLTSGTLEYTASNHVPYKVTNVNVLMDTNYATAILSNKNVTWNLNTDNNTDYENIFTVNVKSEECNPIYASVPGIPSTCPENNYKFKITRKAPSKDLSLDNLTLDGTQITGFTSTKDNYEVVVPSDKTSINIDAIIHDKLNHIESGTGNNLSLNPGDNNFTIVLKSEDGTTTKNYNIKIHRAIKYLKTLKLETTPDGTSGTLSPTFSGSGNKDYTYSYDAKTTNIKVTATVEDTDHAYVTILDISSGDSSDTTSKVLNTTSKTITNATKKVKIIVTDASGDDYSYTVTFEQAKSDNKYLKSLSITPSNNNEHGTGLKEEFKKTTTSYTATVNADVKNVTVTALAEDNRAKSIVVTGNDNLNIGNNTINIVVTAEDNTTKTYTITVNRKQYGIAELSDLKLGIRDTTPSTVTGWNKETLEYNLYQEGINEVPYDIDKATISYAVNSEYNMSLTSDTINTNPKTVTLNTGLNTFKIKVTSQDKKAEKEYVIKIYRAKNTDNDTKSVTVKGINATPKADEDNAYTVTLPNNITSINGSDVVVLADASAIVNKTTSTLSLSTTTDNIFNYTITSEFGETEIYKIYIIREKSEEASMSVMKLKIDKAGEDYSYSCIPNAARECTINVPNGTSAYFLKADISSYAKITPENETRYEMGLSKEESTKVHTFTVTPESENTANQKVYTITVKRALSTNTDLSTLTITDVTGASTPIDFTYTGGTLVNITVPSNIAKVKLDATLADALSTITTDLTEIHNLDFGVNNLTITVKPEDPDRSDTIYHINITREKSSDASLSSLILGSDTSSVLTGGETTYPYPEQDYNTTTLNIAAITRDSLANISKITVNDEEQTFTKGNNVTTQVPLKTGSNIIKIEVTAHNDTKNTYTINVSRAKNNDTGIQTIKVKNGTDFINATRSLTDNHTFILDDFVPNSKDSIKNEDVIITVNNGATATDPLAKASVSKTDLLTLDNDGNYIENRVPITVTSEDGTLDTYYLIVKRTASSVKDLTRVNLYQNDSTSITTYITFDNATTTGTINVTEDTTKFRLEGILKDTLGTVSFIDGPEYVLNNTESTKVVTARVTAEDKTTKDYTITIQKAASSNSYLGELKTNANSDTLENITITEELNYNLTVPGTQDEIEIFARSFDPKSKVEIIGEDGNPIENTTDNVSFTRSLKYNSENGGKANEIKLRVTAENTTSKTIYTLFVTREENTDAILKEIAINNDKTVINTNSCIRHEEGIYNGKVVCSVNDIYDYEFANVRISATNNDINGSYRVSTNSTDGPYNVSINTIYYGRDYTATEEYQNVINIRSFAHNKSIYQDYVVLLKRKANTSTVVSKVEVYYDGSLHEASWNSIKNVYEISVPNNVNELSLNDNVDGFVKVTPNEVEAPGRDKYSAISMDNKTLVTNDSISGNVNTHTFVVTAEAGNSKTYTMEVTRALSSEARLDNIIVETYKDNVRLEDDGVYNKTFNKDTLEYNVVVGVDTNRLKLNIIPTTNNLGTTDVSSEYNLSESTKTITIHSYAEDGSGPVTYILNIQRQKNDKNDLQNIVVRDKDGNTYPVMFSDTNEEFVGPLESDERILKVAVPGDVSVVEVIATPTTNLGSVNYSGANKVDGTNSDYNLPVKSITRASIRIVSEFGSSKTYKLDIERQKRNSANLMNLVYTLISTNSSIEPHTLNDLDGDGDKVYNLGTVPNEFSSILISADVNSATGATLSGSIGTFPILTNKNNEYVITVTAEDGITTKTYTLQLKRESSDEARLKNLDITDLTITPTFDKDTYEYNVNIPEGANTFSCNDLRYEKMSSVSKAVCDEEITLLNGETKDFHITVTPESGDENLIKVYTIHVTRTKSSNNFIKSISVNGGTSPKLNKAQTEYTISIPESNVSGDFIVTVELEDSEYATINPSDLLNDGITYNVVDNVIEMVVTAQDESTRKYTFNIISATAHDATLVDLSVTGYPFTKDFDPTDYAYNLNKDLDRSNSQLVVYATPKNPNATLEYYHDNEQISDCDNLQSCTIDISKYNLGTYTIHIKVTPEDNDKTGEKEYTITYTKDRSTDNLLTNIKVLDPSIGNIKFSPGVTRYTLDVSNEVEEVELRISPSSPYATTTVDGTVLDASQLYTVTDLEEGITKDVSIIVKAEKGETKEYVVSITRKGASLSSDNFLSNLEVVNYSFVGDTFNPSIPSYTIGTIPWNTTSLTINATKNVEAQTIEYYVNGTKQESNIVSIPKQENTTITVKVIAEDGTKNDYIIKLKKVADKNVHLLNIEIDKGNLVFNENTYTYDVSVPSDTNQINVTATAKNDTQAIVLNSEAYISGSVRTINLTDKETILRFVVTSESGSFQTYIITVTKDDNVEDEKITSIEYGHVIESGYIKTVVEKQTVLNIKDQLDNDNNRLEVWDITDTNKLSDTDAIGTGCIVKLLKDSEVIDSKIVIVLGDVDGDGVVDMIDAGKVANHFMKRNNLTGSLFIAANVDNSEEVDMIDAGKIANHFMKRNSLHNYKG